MAKQKRERLSFRQAMRKKKNQYGKLNTQLGLKHTHTQCKKNFS